MYLMFACLESYQQPLHSLYCLQNTFSRPGCSIGEQVQAIMQPCRLLQGHTITASFIFSPVRTCTHNKGHVALWTDLINAVNAYSIHSCARSNFAHQVSVHHEGQVIGKLTSGHCLWSLLQYQ